LIASEKQKNFSARPKKIFPQREKKISDDWPNYSLVTPPRMELLIIIFINESTGTHTPLLLVYPSLRGKLTYAHPQVVKGYDSSLTDIPTHLILTGI